MEPYRNRGGPMAEKEYGAARQRAGWVKMTHPELPDNDPIFVLEAAVSAKLSKGWEIAEDFVMTVPAVDTDEDSSTWELTEDGGELTEDRD